MKAGLYQPDEFKDNCGFGLIAHMQGEPSHTLLQTAIEALTCMTHRGGINAEILESGAIRPGDPVSPA